MLARVRQLGVDTPCVYLVESKKLSKKYFLHSSPQGIYMEFIDGISTKQFIFNNANNKEGLFAVMLPIHH